MSLKKESFSALPPSIASRWLTRTPRRRTQFDGIKVVGVEERDFSINFYKKVLYTIRMVNFLDLYFEDKSINFKETEYWHLLMRRYTGNYKRELNNKDYNRAMARLNSFIKLCINIEKNGWKGNNSYICLLRPVDITDEKLVRKLFGRTILETYNNDGPIIGDKKKPLFKLIDGHHRLSCAYHLHLNRVPTKIFYVGRV